MMAAPGCPQLAANDYLAPAEIGVPEFMGHARNAGARGIGLTLAAHATHGPEELAGLAAGHGLFISTLNSAGYLLFGILTTALRELREMTIG